MTTKSKTKTSTVSNPTRSAGTNVQVNQSVALKQMKLHRDTQIAYNPEARTIAGRQYVIVPVVMIREGVHHGSAGPLLHIAEELEKSVPLWDGKPVTISHPQVNGVFVSADDPEIAKDWVVGEVHDVRMEGDKLRANAWLDVLRLTALSPVTLEKVMNGELMEVSVGVFSEEEPTAGEWKGEKYEAINRNYIPDHLALLPGEVGACSVLDGCGLRVNKNQKKGGELNVLNLKLLNDLNKRGITVSPIVNEVSFSEIMDQIWSVMDNKSNDKERFYLDAVYDDYFIYRKRTLTEVSDGDVVVTDDAGYYKQNYQIGADDKVNFVGDPAKVKKTVSYITLQEQAKMRRTKFNNNKNEEGVNMCKPCKEKAGLLIANANTHYREEHREWLESLDEDKLDILIANAVAKPQTNQTPAAPAEITKEQAWKTLGLSQAHYEAGVKFYNEQRTELIQTILTNSEKDADGKPIFTEEDFKEVKLDVLRKMAQAIRPVKRQNNAAGGDQSFANYMGMGGGGHSDESDHEEEPLTMPGVELKD